MTICNKCNEKIKGEVFWSDDEEICEDCFNSELDYFDSLNDERRLK